MHARLIALVGKKDGDSSETVRASAEQELIDNGFAGEGGLFSSPPADWFVIGGRWSGELSWWRLGRDSERSFYEEARKRDLAQYGGNPSKEQYDQQRVALFHEMFFNFQGLPPVGRDQYQDGGYDDDAQVLDEVLFAELGMLKRFDDREALLDGNSYIDLDDPGGELTRDAIGKKWCVVVDFHY